MARTFTILEKAYGMIIGSTTQILKEMREM